MLRKVLGGVLLLVRAISKPNGKHTDALTPERNWALEFEGPADCPFEQLLYNSKPCKHIWRS